jgi:superfamily II DNA helicase RecQ
VIFHDRVLYAIAREQPRTLAALADVAGVGRGVRLQAYGQEVLEILRERE